MPNFLRPLYRPGTALLALGLAACAHQPPAQETAEQTEPQVDQPLVRYVPDKSFDAETLYALLVAEIAGSRNRYDITVSNYVQQALATRDPGVTARAARIARLLNSPDAALEMAQQWLELEPYNPEAHFIAGAELTRRGQLLEAVEHAAVLAKQGEESFFEAIAANAVQNSDADTVARLHDRYSQLIETYPQDASLHLGQSLLLFAMDDLEASLAFARRAGSLQPDSYQPALQEMRILQEMGHEDEAREGLARLVERYPDNQRLRLQYARMLTEGDLATAQKQFRTLVEQSPGDPDFTLSLALIQMERGLLVEAKQQLEILAQGTEHRDTAHYYLGQIAGSRGDAEQALEHFQQVSQGANYLAAVMEAAELMVEMHGVATTVAYIQGERQQASAAHGDSLYLIEAEIHGETGAPAEALEVLDAGLQEYPQSLRLLYARAMLHTEANNLKAAEQDLQQIIALAPDNAAALNALGYTLADRTNRLDEAYGYIRAALELEPNDAAILDSMGWVLYRMGDHDQAVEYLRQAMAEMPDDEIASHLGEVLWVLGKKEQARDIWRRGLEVNPGSRLIRDAMDRLGAGLDDN